MQLEDRAKCVNLFYMKQIIADEFRPGVETFGQFEQFTGQ